MIVAYIPDLLFGSKVTGALSAAGHEVRQVWTLDGVEDAELLIVDLTADARIRIEQARGLAVPKLAFYSHVESEVRAQAEQAGFDLVVPRSRMAREGAELAARFVGGE